MSVILPFLQWSILTRVCPSDIAVSISSLFPVVYGTLYHFDPSKQGLLYLPMLAGSLLAEVGTGQAGDRCVAADLSGPLGLLIGKRNAEYAANKKAAADVESSTSFSALRRPEDDVRSDSTKVPEMRLIIALLGMLICIVSCTPSMDPRRSVLIRTPPGRPFVVRFRG